MARRSAARGPMWRGTKVSESSSETGLLVAVIAILALRPPLGRRVRQQDRVADQEPSATDVWRKVARARETYQTRRTFATWRADQEQRSLASQYGPRSGAVISGWA